MLHMGNIPFRNDSGRLVVDTTSKRERDYGVRDDDAIIVLDIEQTDTHLKLRYRYETQIHMRDETQMMSEVMPL